MKENPYHFGDNVAFTPIPKFTDGFIGYANVIDGLFIEFDNKDNFKIVLRKDGVDYKQSFEEFINNSKNK